jgi:hypothetical protein
MKKVEPGWKRREEPLHPGSLLALYQPCPTLQHKSTLISHLHPLSRHSATIAAHGASARIEGGLEIRVSRPAGATQLFGELKGLLGGLNSTQVRIGQLSAAGVDRGFTATVPGLPFVIDIAQKGNLLLGTVGSGALADALSASNRLGSSATAALLGSGVRPLLALSLPAVAKLLQSLGAASSSTAAQILPYLNSLGRLAVGQSLSGNYVIERIALG